MGPYDDETCGCHEIENKINAEFPEANWNLDSACKAWGDRKQGLLNNNIEFTPFSDENYGCTCPSCGRMICSWCV